MSLHQAKAESSGAQLKKPGRSSGVAVQKLEKGGGGGGGPAPSASRGNQSNAAGGESRGSLNAGQGVLLLGAPGGFLSPATRQLNVLDPKSNGLLPKPPIQEALSTRTSEQAPPGPARAASGELSRGMFRQPFAFQFGSFSPGLINGMQFPAPTSSVPPNFDEQKCDQVCVGSVSTTFVTEVPMILPRSQQKLQDRVVLKQAAITLDTPVEGKRILLGASGRLPVFQTQQPPILSGVGIGALSAQIQSQGVTPGPPSVQLQLQMATSVQTQSQQSLSGMQNLQPNTLQSQQGMMHQVQDLNFPQPLHPHLPHVIPQQVNSLTSHMPSQQLYHIQMGPQAVGANAGVFPTYIPPPSSQYIPQRSNTVVKITHPETHKVLKFGPKDDKLESQADNDAVALVPDSITLLGGLPTYGPSQSCPPVASSGPHQLNLYSATQERSYGQPSSNFSWPHAEDVPLSSASSVRNDLGHLPLSQNSSFIIDSGTPSDKSKPFTEAAERSLTPSKFVDAKMSCLTSSVPQSSDGLSPLTVSAAFKGEISGSQSVTAVAEVPSSETPDAGLKSTPMCTSAMATNSMLSSCSSVSVPEVGPNHSAGGKKKTELIKSAGVSTRGHPKKMTNNETRHKKLELQKQAVSPVLLHENSVSLTSKAEVDLKGKVVAEASFKEGGIMHTEAERPISCQTSSISSTASKSAPQNIQKSETYCAWMASSALNNVFDNGVSSGASPEFVRETIGNVLHLSSVDPAYLLSSVRDSLKADEISAAMQAEGEVANATGSLSEGGTGTSVGVDDVSGKGNCLKLSQSLGDSKPEVELAGFGQSSYGRILASKCVSTAGTPGPSEDVSVKDAGETNKAVHLSWGGISNEGFKCVCMTVTTETAEEVAVKANGVVNEATDFKLGDTSKDIETSMSSLSSQPNVGSTSSLGEGKIPNFELTSNADAQGLHNISLESLHRGCEGPGVVQHLVLLHENETEVSESLTALTDTPDYFVESESVVTSEQDRTHDVDNKIHKIKHRGLPSEHSPLGLDSSLVKELKDESLGAACKLLAGSAEVSEERFSSDVSAPSLVPDVCIMQKQLAFAGCDKLSDSKLSLGYRTENKGSGGTVTGITEDETNHVKVVAIQDCERLSASNASIGKAIAAHHQGSLLPAESKEKFDLFGRVREKESISSHSNVSSKSKVTSIGDATKIVGNKKKKKREFLIKADAAAPTGDLYNAYKASDVKDEKQEHVKSQEVLKVVDTVDNVKGTSVKESDKQAPKEWDDWEDAAELSATVKQVDAPKVKNSGDRKYTRDFLLTFRFQIKDLPLLFEFQHDLMDIFIKPQAIASHLGDCEALEGLQRALYRQPSGNSRLECHGSNGGTAHEDRWNKLAERLPSVYDMQMQEGRGCPPGGLCPGQGLSPCFARNVHGVPMNTFASGTPPGGAFMKMPFSQCGLQRNSSDVDRWQCAFGLQKGFIPLQATLPAIHKTENRYEVAKVSDEGQLKQRQIKSILNKLTPQNFDRLFVQVKEVNIDSANCLTGVISQIFDKALMEPTFCEMYAKFCVQLAAGLPEFNEDDEKIMFKRVLLNKCQEEFEKGEREEAEADKIEEDGKVRFSQEESEERKAATRRRMLGNIRFIGELYKESMLTERIMHECIKKLLGEYQNPNEEDIEALCKLMSTIGHMIDHPKAKVHIDAYFDRMTKMSNNRKLSSRPRFMLKDLIDLRKNGWQQRRKVEGPKKIEEVHRDAVHERQAQGGRLSRSPNMGFLGRKHPLPPDYGLQGPGAPLCFPDAAMDSLNHKGGIRGAQPHIGMRGFGGQDALLTDGIHFENRSLSMPVSHRHFDAGPRGGVGRAVTLRGQTVPASRSAITDIPQIITEGNNRQMSLGPMPGYNPHAASGWLPFGGGDEISSRTHGAERPLLAKLGIQEKNVLGNRRRDFRSAYSPDKGRIAADSEIHVQGYSSLGIPQVSSDRMQPRENQLRKMSDMAIKEFYSVRDMKEAALCVDDLRAPWFRATMVSLWVIDSFDRKHGERDLLANLLIHLCKAEPCLLNCEQLLEGLEMVVSSLQDTVVDAPKAPEFLGRILGKLVVAGVIFIDDFVRIIKEECIEPGNLVEMGLALDVLGTLLEVIRRIKGEAALADMYRTSGVRLEDFMPPGEKPGQFEAFLKKNNIQCLHPLSISRHR